MAVAGPREVGCRLLASMYSVEKKKRPRRFPFPIPAPTCAPGGGAGEARWRQRRRGPCAGSRAHPLPPASTLPTFWDCCGHVWTLVPLAILEVRLPDCCGSSDHLPPPRSQRLLLLSTLWTQFPSSLRVSSRRYRFLRGKALLAAVPTKVGGSKDGFDLKECAASCIVALGSGQSRQRVSIFGGLLYVGVRVVVSVPF